MAGKRSKVLQDLTAEAPYPEEAFEFVREGLNYAVQKIHGRESRAHQALAKYLAERKQDWMELIAQYHAGRLDDAVVEAIEAAGGIEKLNRHVSGRQLCWGLRDLALERWGLMARPVLESWRIKRTADFGRIVFSFIEHDLMQKQPGDTLEDFEEVYDFKDAFDETFRRALGSAEVGNEEDEDEDETAEP
ncbi:MAG TPA: hypothetical protein PKK06_13010 [Phycisphaerae bacterium]|nr:hypothetical protein [Phycisphaerae bacterium]HNU44400.1 hypothetical protein [Phycisphaerae bacterium]